MPSGATHDRITLWCLPMVAGATLGLTRSSNLTLIVSGGFLFSGLMFGPDLDLNSRPYKRWGWLRWIWIPYQKSLRHRSVFSHGLIIGTTLRSLYLFFWLFLLALLIAAIVQLVWGRAWNWQVVADVVLQSSQYPSEWMALFAGLELGAMSHSFSDWGGSAYKRLQKGGVGALMPKRVKRKPRGKKRTAKTQRTRKVR
ncbi:metal-binding protein [Funiculus sociatus GB2-A5]|uniref:Metal-binding protein n=1 Tax=Funiculus sociatus GB2-A5 TaxID=2933946 RepID=A0ABV0JS30_9CYAN|nr:MULTISPECIES: metal-binding protein [unclassified Trichocoleus]MBD1907995.1 metal-binding protein [Trichocoleus sp. FACHB-832]MBD2061550.1 metal-binding protein [Trichocoleus sp. FACHB-6]